MNRRTLLRTAAATVVVTACGSPAATPGGTATKSPSASSSAASASATSATVELVKGGTFTFALRPDKAPKTVANFARKSRAGDYDGTTFHRVVPGFVAQGGDPLSKTLPASDLRLGTGGGNQDTELSDLPFDKGAVGIARGPDIKVSNDSQFYVCLDAALNLNGQYTNFGKVTNGMNVVLGIKVGDKIKTIKVE
jgi:cyclophilin family peptidyl-prolyl cis-trans isomerase